MRPMAAGVVIILGFDSSPCRRPRLGILVFVDGSRKETLLALVTQKSRANRNGGAAIKTLGDQKRERGDIEEEEEEENSPRKKLGDLGNLRPRLHHHRKQKKHKKTGGLGPDHLAHQAKQTAVPGPGGHLGCRKQRPRDRLRWGWGERALKGGEERREKEGGKGFRERRLFFFFASLAFLLFLFFFTSPLPCTLLRSLPPTPLL